MQSKSIYKILTRRLLFKRLSQFLVLAVLLSSSYIFITNSAKTSKAVVWEVNGDLNIAGDSTGSSFVVGPEGRLYGYNATDPNDPYDSENLSNRNVTVNTGARLIFSGKQTEMRSLNLYNRSSITHVGPGDTKRSLEQTKTSDFAMIVEGWIKVPTPWVTSNFAVNHDDAIRLYVDINDNSNDFFEQDDDDYNNYLDDRNTFTQYPKVVHSSDLIHYKIYFTSLSGANYLRIGSGTVGLGYQNDFPPESFYSSKSEAISGLPAGQGRINTQFYSNSHDWNGEGGVRGLPQMENIFHTDNLLFVNPSERIARVQNVRFDLRPYAPLLSYDREVNLKVDGQLGLFSGSTIDANNVGYLPRDINMDNGIAQWASNQQQGESDDGAAGGSHGGKGGEGYDDGTYPRDTGHTGNYLSGPIYDNETDPNDYGMGGGCSDIDGGSGGGLIIIEAQTLRIGWASSNQSGISSDGEHGYFYSLNKCGGGAGGTINLRATNIFITTGKSNLSHDLVMFSTRGGPGGRDTGSGADEPGGGGGGGRIAIHYQAITLNGVGATDLNQFTDVSGGGSQIDNINRPGFSESIGHSGTVIFDNGISSPTVTKTLEAVSRTLSNGTTITDFNPYSMQVGDTIKVTLNVLGIRGGETLIDNALLYNAPTTSKDFICRPQRSTANPEPSVPINATSNSVTWNADTSVTSYYYECIIQEMP